MLRAGDLSVSTTAQAVLLIDLCDLVMYLCCVLSVGNQAFPLKYPTIGQIPIFVYRHNRAMTMDICLIQVYVEAYDVVFSVLVCYVLIHVFSPVLDAFLSGDMRVVGTFGKVNDVS